MNPTEIFRSVLDNSDRITSFVLLICICLVLGYMTYSLLTGKFASLSDYRRLTEDYKTLKLSHDDANKVLSAAKDELAESRAVYRAAMVRIEFMERDLRLKDTELNVLRSRVSSLENELSERGRR